MNPNNLFHPARVRLLRIWDLLQRESDVAHPLSAEAVLSELKAEGIACDLRTLKTDISALKFFGYPIKSAKEGKSEAFFCAGTPRLNREDLRLLEGAVRSSGLKEPEAAALLEKLRALSDAENKRNHAEKP